jgi:uncharacterized RDD family membrane protein YckC
MSELSINTTQNVNIKFTSAPVGERILASVIDLLIKIAYCLVIYYLFYELLGLNKIIENMDGWSQGAIGILLFFPIFIYSIVLESMFEGQTIGKKLLKMKVVKIDGYQANFGDYLIRWLFRIIEKNYIMVVVGFITLIVSKKTQRLGDMAAGTAVITLKSNVSISSTILEEIGNAYVPTYALVIKLSDNDVRIIKETFKAAQKNEDHEVVHKLRLKIENVAGITNQSGNNVDFIRTVLKDYNYYTQNM